MSRQPLNIKTVLCHWFAQETRGLVGGLIGGIGSAFIAFTLFNYRDTPLSSAGPVDAVSIANTYVAFASFVIAAVTILLGAIAIVFAQHFSTEKQTHLSYAYDALTKELSTVNGKAMEVMKGVMQHPEVVEYINECLQMKVAECIQELKAQAGQQEKQARLNLDILDMVDMSPKKPKQSFHLDSGDPA